MSLFTKSDSENFKTVGRPSKQEEAWQIKIKTQIQLQIQIQIQILVPSTQEETSRKEKEPAHQTRNVGVKSSLEHCLKIRTPCTNLPNNHVNAVNSYNSKCVILELENNMQVSTLCDRTLKIKKK